MSSHPALLVLLLLILTGVLVGSRPVLAAGPGDVAVSSKGSIRIWCIPGRVMLGEDREAQLRIELDPSATGLELFVSRGEVGPLTRVEPGVFHATYVPPRQNLPLEVILVALARGPRGMLDGRLVLPLWGHGLAEVRTRARAPVTLRVGEQTFGPIRADKAGRARIPVRVPPGVQEAWFGRKRIDLGLPPQPLVHAVAERREVWADREETVDIRLYSLKREGGLPALGSFSVSRGRVSAPVELEPGVFLLRWTVPPGPAGTLELKGSATGKGPPSLTVRLAAVSAPARRIEKPEEVRAEAVGERTPPPPLRRRPVLEMSPHVGVMTNFADVLAPSAGVRLEVWPVPSLPDLGLMLDSGYLRFSRRGGVAVPGFLGHNELFDTTAAVGLRRQWENGLQGWVAAGLSVVRVRSRVGWNEKPSREEGTWVLGTQAMVGVGVPFGPGQPFLEARFCWFDDPSLDVLRGSLRGGGLHLGYRLALF